ncbi:MAG: hypothetical protein U0269_32985 [Polyangiales bacterium]
MASILSLCAPSVAYGQSADELAARRALIEQAETARTSGQHAQALAYAERAAAIQMSPSLRLFIAREQQALRQYASALGNSEVCVRDADRDASLRNREDILAACRAVTAEIQSSSGRVVVHVATPVDGLEVRVGDIAIRSTVFDAPYVVATGALTIRASAPGYRSFERTIDVAQGTSTNVEVNLERIEADAQRPPPPPLQTRAQGPGVGPWVVVGVGGAGLIAGGALWLVASMQKGALDAACPGDATRVCGSLSSAEIDARVGSINGLSTGAVIAGSVGGAAVLGGVLWYALAPRRTVQESVSAAVIPTRGGATISIGGRF